MMLLKYAEAVWIKCKRNLWRSTSNSIIFTLIMPMFSERVSRLSTVVRLLRLHKESSILNWVVWGGSVMGIQGPKTDVGKELFRSSSESYTGSCITWLHLDGCFNKVSNLCRNVWESRVLLWMFQSNCKWIIRCMSFNLFISQFSCDYF